jgi:hypothetical protein
LQYELGAEHYKQRRWADAAERFAASNRLVPNAGVTFNLAQTFALMKRWTDAYNHYSRYLSFTLSEAERRDGEAAREKLLGRVAVIEISTEPPGIELFVDRVDLGSVGQSPLQLAVEPGERAVIGRTLGHHEAHVSVVTVRGQRVPVNLVLTAMRGELYVTSTPVGAEVLSEVNQQRIGITPLQATLAPGQHRLTVQAPGFQPRSVVAEIKDRETTALEVTLERDRSTLALLSVNALPVGAEVHVDGVRIGQVPLTIDVLNPGRHRVEIRSEGRRTWHTDALFEAGAATRVQATLADPSNDAWSGWRWIGYGTGGALIGVGGVVGMLAVSAKSDFDAKPTSDGLSRVESRNLAADIALASGVVVIVGTLLWDILSPAPETSTGTVRVDR